MPFATHRGQKIHYTIEGAGPLVVLQHGFLSSADSWRQSGTVAALADAYRVACVDSLGHGLSDKPAEAALYGLEARCGDIVAVIDDLGEERAHLVGYSMGGWMALGVAARHPRRLASVVVGGWDVQDGAQAVRAAGAEPPPSFDVFLRRAGAARPDLVAWITEDAKPGLWACWEALRRHDGGAEALTAAPFPVMLWNGREDAPHDPMRAFAAANGLRFLSTAGDHSGARTTYAAEGSAGVRAFLDSLKSPSRVSEPREAAHDVLEDARDRT